MSTEFSTRRPIGKVTDKDNGRFDLEQVVVMPDAYRPGVVLFSTDGRRAAAVLEDGHADEQHYVPSDVFPNRIVRNATQCSLDDDNWKVVDGQGTRKVVNYPAVKPGEVRARYPRIGSIFPECRYFDHKNTFSVNPKLFYELCLAIGAGEKVTVNISEEGNGCPLILVADGNDDCGKGVGILMPIECDANNASNAYEQVKDSVQMSFDADRLCVKYDNTVEQG